MGKKKEHQWGFMANSGTNGKGELAQCQVNSCRMWRFNNEKPFKMSDTEFKRMNESGEIDATEVLGLRKNEQ